MENKKLENKQYLQEDIKYFIRSFLDGIHDSLEDTHQLNSDIEFELKVIKTKTVQGKFKIIIAEAEGNYSKEKISIVKFKIEPLRQGSRCGVV